MNAPEALPEEVDVAVVGGGLAGLTAATVAARGGRSTVLFERQALLGGRGTSDEIDGFFRNVGPHALYATGTAAKFLRELGVPVPGRTPNPSGFAVRGGALHTLPSGFVSLLSTGLLGLPAKLELGRLLAKLPKIRTEDLDGESVSTWIGKTLRHGEARDMVGALIRLTSYANAPERMCARAAVEQLQRAVAGNVLYVDGGWRTLVDGLAAKAREAGARVVAGRGVRAVEPLDGRWSVRLTGDQILRARDVVLAVPPRNARALLPEARRPGLDEATADFVPVRAACLDVALSSLPRPRATFALGIDEPLYFSVHSAVARVAPEDGAMIHVARYLAPEEAGGDETLSGLTGLLDRLQPGWAERVVDRRFLPSMTVVPALPLAGKGGLAGRPGEAALGDRGLWLAGDWVGADGLLADGSVASGRRAAMRILAESPALETAA